MKGPKMKPHLGRIKSDGGLGRDFIKKRGGKKGKKENLLKIEHGFGYGLTHGLSVLFFLLLKVTFSLSFFKETIVCLIYLFVY